MIVRAHAHGIQGDWSDDSALGRIGYYHPGPESEADRQAINAWIRDPGHFDGVVDFDAGDAGPGSIRI